MAKKRYYAFSQARAILSSLISFAILFWWSLYSIISAESIFGQIMLASVGVFVITHLLEVRNKAYYLTNYDLIQELLQRYAEELQTAFEVEIEAQQRAVRPSSNSEDQRQLQEQKAKVARLKRFWRRTVAAVRFFGFEVSSDHRMYLSFD